MAQPMIQIIQEKATDNGTILAAEFAMIERVWNFGKETENRDYTIVRVNTKKNQVYSFMSRNTPDDGGEWVANYTSDGIRYVTTGEGYSKKYIQRIFNSL